MAEPDPSLHEKEPTTSATKEPTLVQLDPKCLHSALKEFFEPLRTNDPRTDFFAVYRKVSAEFDRDYENKYDEDLNTSLIFAGLFSAVSSAFIIDVQSNLQPDPNEMTAAYMRILIHNMNSSLFPDADPSLVTWTGPPPGIVAVQSLLYASLATSLLAAFLAMLGKQWVNRYVRNRGGSAADKSRDRQRKLDGFEKWRFHLAIESLPVMLQVSLLLLGCALSQYLWTINRTVAGVVVAVTLFGFTSYLVLTLAATFYYDCPYQTPPSTITRTTFKYLTRSDDRFARSLRSFAASLPSINLRPILLRLRSGIITVLKNFGRVPPGPTELERIPLTVVVAPPTEIIREISIDLEVCKADARCIAWVLESTTDTDVIFSTVRFAADMIWYPEIARAVSPHVLADLLFDCFLDGEVIPGKLEYANSVGMALASVLSIQLSVEPQAEGLQEICRHIDSKLQKESPGRSWSIFSLVAAVLRSIASDPISPTEIVERIHRSTPDLSITHRLWLSRIMFHIFWRWRRVQGPTGVLDSQLMASIYRTLTAGDDHTPVILRINCFLTVAISLGLQLDIHDLYSPGTNDALMIAIGLFHRQLRMVIAEGTADKFDLTSVLYALRYLNPFQVTDNEELGFLWIADILNSGYEEGVRCGMAGRVLHALGKRFPLNLSPPFIAVHPTWIPPVLGFLSLWEKSSSPRWSPALTALRILSTSPRSSDFTTEILPILTSTLPPTHPLQSRVLALDLFTGLMSGWFSPQMENIPGKALSSLLQAVDDPFKLPDLPLQDGKPVAPSHYRPMMAAVVLIEFASSDLWRNHLCHSNFASCEEAVSTRKGKWSAFGCMVEIGYSRWPELLGTATKIGTAIRCLEGLRCFNTAELVIMWAWTVGGANPVGHDDWISIGRETLRFYQTHGTRRLAALAQHINTANRAELLIRFYRQNSRGSPEPQAMNDQELTPTPCPPHRSASWCRTYFCLAQACQVRRLYQLFGRDPATWKEAVAVEVDEETGLLPGCPVTPAPFVDWACDYP